MAGPPGAPAPLLGVGLWVSRHERAPWTSPLVGCAAARHAHCMPMALGFDVRSARRLAHQRHSRVELTRHTCATSTPPRARRAFASLAHHFPYHPYHPYHPSHSPTLPHFAQGLVGDGPSDLVGAEADIVVDIWRMPGGVPPSFTIAIT